LGEGRQNEIMMNDTNGIEVKALWAGGCEA
jgi:hypothetical protein